MACAISGNDSQVRSLNPSNSVIDVSSQTQIEHQIQQVRLIDEDPAFYLEEREVAR